MFETITQIALIVYFKEKQNNKFIQELLNENIVPIGCTIKDMESYFRNEKIHEDLLPCIVYKENYRA